MRGIWPGCVTERWIGEVGPGAVVVGPGRLKVREPRLPRLNPLPGRASAVATPRKTAQIAAITTANRKSGLDMLVSQRDPFPGARSEKMETIFRKDYASPMG